MGNITGPKLGLEGQTGIEEAERSREKPQFGGIHFLIIQSRSFYLIPGSELGSGHTQWS